MAERLVVHIADDSNDRLPRSVNTPPYALSDGILARPELPPRRLAYDCDGLRINAVLKRKVAAPKRRDAERLKIVPDLPGLTNRLWRLAPGVCPTFDLNRNRATTVQRQVTRQSNRFHARYVPSAVEQLLVELADFWGFGVSLRGNRNFQREHMVATEPRIGFQQLRKAPHEQSGPDQQDQRQGKFNSNEKTLEAMP